MIVPTDHQHRALPQHSSFMQKNIGPSFTSPEERDGVLNSASQQPMLACNQDRLSQPPLYNSVYNGDLYPQLANPFFVSGGPSSQALFCQEQGPGPGHNMAASSYSSHFFPQPHVSNFWHCTTPDLQHSRSVSSQLNYGVKSEHNVTNESSLDMSGADGSDLHSNIIGIRSESDMVSRILQSSQGTGQESCQNSGAHRHATDQTATSSSQFSYPSDGKTVALKGKRRLRTLEDGECQSQEECMLDDLKKRGCSMTKRSRVAEVHNLSERRRRDRINEKMKTLQELIPNCNKADKASMLEEAIQYLKLLQLQLQVLSMKAMTAYAGVPNVPTYSLTYSPMGMDMGLGMAMGMGMVGMGGTVVHASASDQGIPIFRGSPSILPTSGTVLVSPHGMGVVGMGGSMLSSTIAPTTAVVSSSSTPTVGTVLVGPHDMKMVGMGGTMVSSTIAPTSKNNVVSSTIAPTSPTQLVNPPGMGMVGMGGTTGRAPTSDRVVPTKRGSSTISPTSGTVLDSPREIYGTGMTGMEGTMVHTSISDRVVPTLRASSIISPSSGKVSVDPQEGIYVPSWS